MPPTRRTVAQSFATCAAVAMAALTAPTALARPSAPAQAVPTTQAAAVTRKASPSERGIIRMLRKRVVATALSKQDATYEWGAAGPDTFDCSGLVTWTYRTAVGFSLPHYSGAQMQVTRRIEREKLRRGDLLFYGPGGSQHVTIYIGRRMQIGASGRRSGIVIDSIDSPYRLANYAGAGRVIRLVHLRTGVLP